MSVLIIENADKTNCEFVVDEDGDRIIFYAQNEALGWLDINALDGVCYRLYVCNDDPDDTDEY